LITIFFKKIKNTFLTPTYSSKTLLELFEIDNFFYKFFSKVFWFLPNNSQLRYWKNAENLNHGYQKFIKMDFLSQKILETILKHSNKNDKILDICCNAGRVLNELDSKDYINLYGFDINKEAIKNSDKIFEFKNNVQLSVDTAENYLDNKDDNYFDVTYSLGASLELIPSHYNLVYNISRITKKYHICLINENGHAYPRFWRYEFKKFFSSINCISIESNRTLFILKK